MEDSRIIELFDQRDEQAIAESSAKYGRYCRSVAFNILADVQESDECVNDTWLRAWEAIPPARPESLRAYLGRICRNLALDRWSADHSKKRAADQTALALEELSECISDGSFEGSDDDLKEVINAFLNDLEPTSRKLFVMRYWYLYPVKTIAREMELTESNVKTSLFRLRYKLKSALEKEGINI